ncbi:MAG: hypothetical protein K2O49_03680, partial [Muribaculaceae bacterium]|nr:hypothetical protein [Muribaculaceae bacterium]
DRYKMKITYLPYLLSFLVPISVQAHLTEERFQIKFENEQSRDAFFQEVYTSSTVQKRIIK